MFWPTQFSLENLNCPRASCPPCLEMWENDFLPTLNSFLSEIFSWAHCSYWKSPSKSWLALVYAICLYTPWVLCERKRNYFKNCKLFIPASIKWVTWASLLGHHPQLLSKKCYLASVYCNEKDWYFGWSIGSKNRESQGQLNVLINCLPSLFYSFTKIGGGEANKEFVYQVYLFSHGFIRISICFTLLKVHENLCEAKDFKSWPELMNFSISQLSPTLRSIQCGMWKAI